MKSFETKKKELVQKLIWGTLLSYIGSHGGPGWHIKRLSEEEREIAKQLTSEDFKHWIK